MQRNNFVVATTHRWTQAAIECYKRGCNCAGCYYADFFRKSTGKNICKMKYSVIDLIKNVGTPEIDQERKKQSFLKPRKTKDERPKYSKSTYFWAIVDFLIEKDIASFKTCDIPLSLTSQVTTLKYCKVLSRLGAIETVGKRRDRRHLVNKEKLKEIANGS